MNLYAGVKDLHEALEALLLAAVESLVLMLMFLDDLVVDLVDDHLVGVGLMGRECVTLESDAGDAREARAWC